jgi:hypothetical protein
MYTEHYFSANNKRSLRVQFWYLAQAGKAERGGGERGFGGWGGAGGGMGGGG